MNFDEFDQKIGALRRRYLTLLQRKGSTTPPQELLTEAIEELHIALEELEVAEQELLKQNSDLAVARAAAVSERQRYQDLFEEAPDGYLVTDESGTIREANRAAARLLNVSQQFLVGKPLVIFIAESERHAFYTHLNQLHSLDEVGERKVRLSPRENVSFDAALTVTAVRNQVGQPVAWRWLLRDITLVKQVESRIRTLNAELEQRVVFEAMLKRITDKVRDSLDESQILSAAVQELAIVLGLLGCNAAWYDLKDGTSTICYEYVTKIPTSQGRAAQMSNFPEIYQQLLQGQYFQFCSITPSPVRGHVAMLACPIKSDEGVLGDLWLINHKDYAFNELEIQLVRQVASQCAIAVRQARLYQAAKVQVEELEKLNRLKDDFLSTVSHELRTPMANIKMAIQMLEFASAPEQRERYLKILQAECAREIELINDLLDLQRLEATSYQISLEFVSLQHWLPSIIEPFRSRTQSRQQTLQVNLSPDLPPLHSDRASLERILAELLNNACKYTSAGGEIVLSIRHNSSSPAQSSDEAEATIFTISNEAEIPATQLPRIFEKFYRVLNADPWKQGGTGLGLALVQKLVERLQGTIEVESSRGWTTFTVELPNQPIS